MADDDAAPDGGGTDKSTDERFAAVEAEQREQRGILESIRDMLTGKDDGTGKTVSGDGTGAPEPADMAEQMRQAVRDVNAENAAQAAADAHAADHARMRRPEPETAPREVMVRGKARAQRIMFGGDK